MLAVHGSIDHRVCQIRPCCQLLSTPEAHLLPEAMHLRNLFPPDRIRICYAHDLQLVRVFQRIQAVQDRPMARAHDDGRDLLTHSFSLPFF